MRPPSHRLSRKRYWQVFHRKIYLQNKHHRDWHMRYHWEALGQFQSSASYESFLETTGR